VAVLTAAAVVLLHNRLPSAAAVWQAIENAKWHWLAAAAGAELFSMAMFARQQRRLLRAFGVRISLGRAIAITYGRSAIAISMPAGSALSAGFAFREYRANGASRATAATVMVISGLVSVAAFFLIYLARLVLSAHNPLWTLSMVGAAIAVVVLLVPSVRPQPGAAPQASGRARRGLAQRWPRAGRAVAQVAEALRAARDVPPGHWFLAFGAGVLNWLADLLCLVAAAKAMNLTLSLLELSAVYLATQVVRQIPLTPGGFGLIEASLLAGMVSARAAASAAAAAVLVYRLLSCWLIIPVGFAIVARLSRRSMPDEPHSGEWQTASTLLPSGSRTYAP
jgi:uncharacterized membrane protein YbhN (UPF0104 family)